jgi:hypothetical protein
VHARSHMLNWVGALSQVEKLMLAHHRRERESFGVNTVYINHSVALGFVSPTSRALLENINGIPISPTEVYNTF